MKYFDSNVLLDSATAAILYSEVRDLPIIDYHCHLEAEDIKNNVHLYDVGELMLKSDHYKWRAMRLMGIPEKFITGDATYYEKFLAYASIMPNMVGNPLYYWTQLELKLVFGINRPLTEESAKDIYHEANIKLADIDTQKILKNFKVSYIATTDDPLSELNSHGVYGGIVVAPTYRPDKAFGCDRSYLDKLGKLTDINIENIDNLVEALTKRLDYFVLKGAKLADHGFDTLPKEIIDKKNADKIFAKMGDIAYDERIALAAFLIEKLAPLYKERDMTMQLHFATFRNVNSEAYASLGADRGYDIIGDEIGINSLAKLLDRLNKINGLPRIILYSLNDNATKKLACLSGAFPDVRVGASWWFNDTLNGIKRHLLNISEYAVLGNNLGMLTDSRSHTSYVRFDFFRRILANLVGAFVEKGEYDLTSAKMLMRNICYNNAKEFLKI